MNADRTDLHGLENAAALGALVVFSGGGLLVLLIALFSAPISGWMWALLVAFSAIASLGYLATHGYVLGHDNLTTARLALDKAFIQWTVSAGALAVCVAAVVFLIACDKIVLDGPLVALWFLVLIGVGPLLGLLSFGASMCTTIVGLLLVRKSMHRHFDPRTEAASDAGFSTPL